MSNNYKRNVCFTFFESYLQQGELIKEQFGDEKCAEYFISLIRYALYEETPDDPIIRIFITGLMNTIDANQEKRKRGFVKEDTELTQNIIDYKNQNPDSTQREIAEACQCSPAKVNKVLKNSNYLNSNANVNDNLNHNINTVNVNTNSFSCYETKRSADKRKLEDLTDEELSTLLEEYKKKIKYAELYKKYNLADNELDKTLIKRIEDIQRNRNKLAKKHKFAKELDLDLNTFSMLEDAFSTFDEGVNVSIDLIKEYSNKDEIDANQIVSFFKEKPEYKRSNQNETNTYYQDISQVMVDLNYI